MKNAPVQHAVEHFFYRRFKNHLLRRDHRDTRQTGARLGRFAYKVLKSPRRHAVGNLERIFPDMTHGERERITRACFEHFGSQFCESISIGRFARANRSREEILERFDLVGWEILEELCRGEKGFFLHTGHYGSFEMALYPCGLLLDDYHGVVRPLDNPRIDADLLAIRRQCGATILSKSGVALKMRSAVRDGGRVAIVIDQHVRPSAGIRLPFLGHPAWTSSVLATLALRLDVPIVPFTCTPAPGGRYRLEIREPVRGECPANKKPTDRAVADLTSRVLGEVEKDIRRKPEWWLWMHRRWRDGSPQSTQANALVDHPDQGPAVGA